MTRHTAKKKQSAHLRLTGMSREQIANQLKVSSKTIERWEDTEEYKEVFEKEQNRILEAQKKAIESHIDIPQSIIDAQNTILDIMMNAEKDAVRLSAAKYWLERHFPVKHSKPEEAKEEGFASVFAKMKEKKAKEKV